ncbi:MAG: hypothetical protein R3F10_11215 [Lysobacteraceae bacterium]
MAYIEMHGAKPRVALCERRSLRRRKAVREGVRQREHSERDGVVSERCGAGLGSHQSRGIVRFGCGALGRNGHRFWPDFIERDGVFGMRGGHGIDQWRTNQAESKAGGQQQSKQDRHHGDLIAGSDMAVTSANHA